MSAFFGLSFVLLSLSHLLAISGDKVYTLLPKYFEIIGYSANSTGFIMSFYGLGGLFAIPLLFVIIDRIRKEYIIIFALICNALLSYGYLIPMANEKLYALPRFAQGAMFTLMAVCYTALISLLVSKEKRVQGLALFCITGQIGLLFSINVGEIIFDTRGLLSLYFFSLVLFIGSLVLILLIVRNIDHSEEKTGLSKQPSVFLKSLDLKRLLPICIWIFLFGFGYGTIQVFLPKWVLTSGLKLISPFYIAFPLTVIVSRIFFGKYLDLLPKYQTLLLPLFLLPLSLVAVIFINSYVILALVGVIYGLCHSIIYPILLSFLMDYSDVSVRGRITLLFQSLLHMGLFVSSLTGGYIAVTSVKWTFLISSIIVSMGLVLWMFVKHTFKSDYLAAP